MLTIKDFQYYLYFLLTLNIAFIFFKTPLYKTKSYITQNHEQDKEEKPILFLQKQDQMQYVDYAYYAISRLYKRISTFNNTSCKISAQYILYTIAGVDEKEDMNTLYLVNDIYKNIQNIKKKLIENNIIQIEIKPNHHFVIFKKNDTHLYLLQGFQDIYYLKEWMENKEVMKPHWKIDEFFKEFENLLNINSKEKNLMDLLKSLFYPDYFSNGNKNKIKKFEDWFKRKLPVYLVNVNFMKYNFINKGASQKDFHKDFIKAAKNYHV